MSDGSGIGQTQQDSVVRRKEKYKPKQCKYKIFRKLLFVVLTWFFPTDHRHCAYFLRSASTPQHLTSACWRAGIWSSLHRSNSNFSFTWSIVFLGFILFGTETNSFRQRLRNARWCYFHFQCSATKEHEKQEADVRIRWRNRSFEHAKPWSGQCIRTNQMRTGEDGHTNDTPGTQSLSIQFYAAVSVHGICFRCQAQCFTTKVLSKNLLCL